MGYLSGFVTAILIYGFSWGMAVTGMGSDKFPGDVSVRAESTSSGRIRGRSGLRGGK